MSSGGRCDRPEISIILPTYNEAGNIKPLYSRLVSALEASRIKCFELIFVDDESTDGTIDVIEALASSDPRVRLIVRRGERGLATAILEGLKRSRGNIAVVMDTDLQHPPETVPSLVEAVRNGYDIAVASRYAKGGGVEGWSRLRLVMSRGASILAWILLPESRRTSDPMSGFFALNTRKLKISAKSGKGFKILLDLLYLNPYAKVMDIPFTFKKRSSGKSKLTWRTMAEYVVQLLTLSSMPKFLAVGALGSIVNLLVFTAVYRSTGIHELSSILGFEAGLIHNAILHDRFTFANRAKWRREGFLVRLLKYNASSAGGIATGVLTSLILFRLAGVEPLVAQALGIGAGFIVNFTLASKYVWR